MRRLASFVLISLLSLTACQEGGETPATAAGGAAGPALQAQLQSLTAEGKVDEIVALLEPMRIAGTLSQTDALLLAEARVSQNELPKAIKVLKASIDQAPDALQHSLLLARVYTSIGQTKLSMNVLLAARAAGGTGAELALESGLAHGRVGELAQAREQLELAREQGASEDDVDYNLSLILMEQGNFEEAGVILANLLERDTSKQYVRRELARAIMRSDPANGDEVRDLCNIVLEENEEDWRAWELLGDVELHQQDFHAAQTYYTKALEFGTKEIGNNPPRVESKYGVAALALRQEFEAAGMIPDKGDVQPSSPPPMPTGYQERRREARRKALEAEKAAAGGAENGPPADAHDGR